MSRLLLRSILLASLLAAYSAYLYAYGYKFIPWFNIDFQSFYATAQVTFREHASPYTRDALADDEKLLGHGTRPIPFGKQVIKIGPYLYPPPSLLLFYPLTLVSYRTAKVGLLFVNHICLVVLGWLTFKHILRTRFQQLREQFAAAAAIAYTLLFYPLVATLADGQVNILTLLCLSVTWFGLKFNRHPLLIAIPLAIAILLKTYPILFLALLLMQRQYRATFWVVALLALSTGVAFLILPQPVWHDWLVNVVPTGGYAKTPFNLFSPAQQRNHNINGFFARLFTNNGFVEPLAVHPGAARWLTYLAAAAIITATTAVCYRSIKHRPGNPAVIDYTYSCFLLMITLVAPLTWESHIIFALPAAFVGIYTLARTASARWWIMMVAASLITLAADLHNENPILTHGWLRWLIPAKFYALVSLWTVFLWKIATAREEAQLP
jgi:hypothetical protein